MTIPNPIRRGAKALLGAGLLALSLVCGGGGGGAVAPPSPPIIGSFSAAQTTLSPGAATTLTAVFSGGTGSVSPGLGAVASGASISTGALSATTTFTLTVTSAAGASVSATATVDVVAAPVISSFTNNGTVTQGSPAVLLATFSGGTGVVTPGNLSITSGKLLVTGPLVSPTTFTLTVTGPAGTPVTSTTQVGESPVRNALNLSLTPPPAGAEALVAVYGPGGLIASASTPESFTGLSSGTYSVVPAGVWGSGALLGQVFQATGGQGFQFTTGAAGSATVTYSGASSLTLQIPDASQPGATVPLVLVPLPAGEFQMGAYDGEQDSQSFETPRHPVTLSRAIFMAEFPTTQAQWKAVTGSNPSNFCLANQGSVTDDFTRPVETVSWNDVNAPAQGFLALLNAATQAQRPQGTTFRLPTEAEWEYACRGATSTRFFWGDDPFLSVIDHYAWWSFDSADTTHPVGSLGPASANPFGLFDMTGNVFEWCQDWYGPYAGGAQTDPAGPGSGTYRVVRGGAWYHGGIYCRSANRSYSGVDDRFSSIGFRVVLAPSGP